MTTASRASDTASSLRRWWAAGASDPPGTAEPAVAADLLRGLVRDSMLDLPRPGHGHTRDRFAALTALGEIDLTVARLAEAHTDALAILEELPHEPLPVEAGAVWAVWAAEPPTAVLTASADSAEGWTIDGRKAWCSGTGGTSYALVTAHAPDGPRLFAVDLSQPGVRRLDDPWPTPALRGSDTRTVEFDQVAAWPVGGPNSYVERPGFWQGSVGVAAVWFGGAVGVARSLARAGAERGLSELNLAHLGGVGTSLAAAHACLEVTATAIDEDPCDERGRLIASARAARAVVEQSATDVITRVGRALGAAPLALDAEHGRRVADLLLYLRQSHGDRDLADLGAELVKTGALR
jgi:alkylation response protein AidB-like acyl-CoA dehydrogenase